MTTTTHKPIPQRGGVAGADAAEAAGEQAADWRIAEGRGGMPP